MQLTIEIDDQVSARLQELAESDLPESRRRLVQDATREALQRTIEMNPVDTGRSRAAWVAALTQAGGSPPPGWRGPHPQGGAIAQGASLGGLEPSDEGDTTSLTARNQVQYVAFLEYGTSRMSPFAMVRRALAFTQQRVRSLFRFPQS